MTKQMKREWLAALRSGKYRQTKHQLHNGVGFCCLGVLLDACVEGDWEIADSDERGEVDGSPKQAWAFVPAEGPRAVPTASDPESFSDVLDGADMSVLIKMNDDGTRFPDIADWIEANVEAA